MQDQADSQDAAFTAAVFARVLGQIDKPVKLYDGDAVPTADAARADGLLPLFLLEAGAIWETLQGDRVLVPLEADPTARLGVRATGSLAQLPPGTPPEAETGSAASVPLAVTLACLTEAAHAVDDGAVLRADLLLQRWQPRLDEVRHRPQPALRRRSED